MNVSLKKLSATALLTMAMSTPALADGDHGHSGMNMGGSDHMMNSSEMGNMQMVMGHGKINKVMSQNHMMNISHEPISELNWPKMRMNFKVDESVDLSALKPGQEVNFTLQVDKDNNYLIKQVEPK